MTATVGRDRTFGNPNLIRLARFQRFAWLTCPALAVGPAALGAVAGLRSVLYASLIVVAVVSTAWVVAFVRWMSAPATDERRVRCIACEALVDRRGRSTVCPECGGPTFRDSVRARRALRRAVRTGLPGAVAIATVVPTMSLLAVVVFGETGWDWRFLLIYTIAPFIVILTLDGVWRSAVKATD